MNWMRSPIREDWRDSRDWARCWHEHGKGLIDCCPAAPTSITMGVVTYPRADMSDGHGNNTVAAFDISGTLLWRYDTGNDADGITSITGQPQIDSSGNVYVPYRGTASAIGHAGVIKLDSSGSLLWNYDHGSGSGQDSSSANTRQASDFDNNGNIVFRTPYHNGGSFDKQFALVVSPSGSLVTTYTWITTPAAAPGFIYPGLAIDGSGNLYACSNNSLTIEKFDSSAAWVSHVAAYGYLACDKVNGKLYVCFIHTGGSGSLTSTTQIGARWDLSTTTPTQDWIKTYNDLFSADTPDYTTGSPAVPGSPGIGFDASTTTESLAIGRLQSNLGGTHVVCNTVNLSSAGGNNYASVLDTRTSSDQITGDSIGVDGIGSHVVAASNLGRFSDGACVFALTSGGTSWASATLAPHGVSNFKGLAIQTYTP